MAVGDCVGVVVWNCGGAAVGNGGGASVGSGVGVVVGNGDGAGAAVGDGFVVGVAFAVSSISLAWTVASMSGGGVGGASLLLSIVEQAAVVMP